MLRKREHFRRTFAYVGSFEGNVAANTDGIRITQEATPRFPQGAPYAVHDDQGVVAFDWRDIAAALNLACKR